MESDSRGTTCTAPPCRAQAESIHGKPCATAVRSMEATHSTGRGELGQQRRHRRMAHLRSRPGRALAMLGAVDCRQPVALRAHPAVCAVAGAPSPCPASRAAVPAVRPRGLPAVSIRSRLGAKKKMKMKVKERAGLCRRAHTCQSTGAWRTPTTTCRLVCARGVKWELCDWFPASMCVLAWQKAVTAKL